MNPNCSVLIRIFENNARSQWHYVSVEVSASSTQEAEGLAHDFMELYDDESYYEIVKVTWFGLKNGYEYL
jgi:hypothetical protein